jgi:hypothetical protein
MPHKLAAQVLAFPCWAIYGDYDANAPDTKDLIWCTTEELARKVCDKLNEDPRSYNLCYVEGFEGCKTFQYHKVFLLKSDQIVNTLKAALEAVTNE